MSNTLKAYYAFVKSKPCLACGAYPLPGNPNHADHIKPYSPKLNALGTRSHKGHAAYFCVPLCPSCHAKRHSTREESFYESIGYPLPILYAYLAYQMAEFLEAGEKNQGHQEAEK